MKTIVSDQDTHTRQSIKRFLGSFYLLLTHTRNIFFSAQPLKHTDLILVHVPQSGDSGKLTEKTLKVLVIPGLNDIDKFIIFI